MIQARTNGWTTPENAEEYERLLRNELFPGIRETGVEGYLGIQLFRRNVGDEVEFETIMWFGSLDAVRRFADADYDVAYVPSKARAVLSRFDQRSQHYAIRERLDD